MPHKIYLFHLAMGLVRVFLTTGTWLLTEGVCAALVVGCYHLWIPRTWVWVCIRVCCTIVYCDAMTPMVYESLVCSVLVPDVRLNPGSMVDSVLLMHVPCRTEWTHRIGGLTEI